MKELKLVDFRDDYLLEDYLLEHDQWQGWTLMLKHVVMCQHKTIGLLDVLTDEYIGFTELTVDKNEDIVFIHLFLIKDDHQRQGYGTQFFKLLEKRYKSKLGFKLQYLPSALGFWLKQGFEFTNRDFILRK